MDKIPKPVKPFNHSEDLRKKRLDEWKELFKSIHPEIEVYHYYDDEFSKILYDKCTFDNVEFEGSFYEDVRILIFLTKELQLSYIVGLDYNRMFSEREVLQDWYYHNEIGYDTCVPKLVSWEKTYLDLCRISEEIKKEIPKPANSKK